MDDIPVGNVLEVIAAFDSAIALGQDIEAVMRQRIFDPLGMNNTRYEPPVNERAEMATVYTQNEEGELVVAADHYDPAWHPGGGGLECYMFI